MPTATDQQLEQLKQKYQSVFNMIQQQQIRLAHVNMQDNKLFVQGDAPSEDAKNRVWDQIKLVNPNWQSELTADIRVGKPATGEQRSPVEQCGTDLHCQTRRHSLKNCRGDVRQPQRVPEDLRRES